MADVARKDIVKWIDIDNLASDIDALCKSTVSSGTSGRQGMTDCTGFMSENTWSSPGVSVLKKDKSAPWLLGLPISSTLHQRFEFAYRETWEKYQYWDCAADGEENMYGYAGEHVFMYDFYEKNKNFPVFHTMYLVKKASDPEAATHEDILPNSDLTNVKQLVQSDLHEILEWWHLGGEAFRYRTNTPTTSAELYFQSKESCPCGGIYRLAFASIYGNGNSNSLYSENSNHANPDETDVRPFQPYASTVYPWDTKHTQYTLTEVGWDQMIPEDASDNAKYPAPPTGCCFTPLFPLFGGEGMYTRKGCKSTLFTNDIFSNGREGSVTKPFTRVWAGTYKEYNREMEKGTLPEHAIPEELNSYEPHSTYEIWSNICGAGAGTATVRVTTMRFIYTADNLYSETESKLRVVIVKVPTAIILNLNGEFVPAIRKRWYDMMYYKLRFIIGHHKEDDESGPPSKPDTVGTTWDKEAEDLFINPSEATMWLADTGWSDGSGAFARIKNADSPFYMAPYEEIVYVGDGSDSSEEHSTEVAWYSYSNVDASYLPTTPDEDDYGNKKSGSFVVPVDDCTLYADLEVDDWGTLTITGNGATYSINVTPEAKPECADANGGNHNCYNTVFTLDPPPVLSAGTYTYVATQTNVQGYADNNNKLIFHISLSIPGGDDSSYVICRQGDCSSPNTNKLEFKELSSPSEMILSAPASFRWGEKYMEQFLCISNSASYGQALDAVECPGYGLYNKDEGGFGSDGEAGGRCGFVTCDVPVTLPWNGGCGNEICTQEAEADEDSSDEESANPDESIDNQGTPTYYTTHAYTYNTLVDILEFTQQHKVPERSLELQDVRGWKFCFRTGKTSGQMATYKFLSPYYVPPCLDLSGGNPTETPGEVCPSTPCNEVECTGSFYGTAMNSLSCEAYNSMIETDASGPFEIAGNTLYVDNTIGRSPYHILLWKTFLYPANGTMPQLKISAENLQAMLCLPRDFNGPEYGVARICAPCGYVAGNVYVGPINNEIQYIDSFMLTAANTSEDTSPTLCDPDSRTPHNYPFSISNDTAVGFINLPSALSTADGQYRYTVIISMCIDHDGCGMAGGGAYSDYSLGAAAVGEECCEWQELLNAAMAGSPYKSGIQGTMTFELM